METQKPLLKDEDGEEVDVHLYRSMIGSLMYLTSSRPDIMFVVCACARYQVNPKISHIYAVKRIFRYLKGQPKLGLWYPKDSPFDLVAYTDSDYAGASLDRKSTTGGCQFLRSRLKSCQCKKQTMVVNSTTEAEYVAALSCCGQLYLILLVKAKNNVRLMMEKLAIGKNRKSDLVRKRIERNWHNLLLLSYYCWVTYYCQLKVNAVRHNLLLLSYYCWVTYYCQLKVNAVRHNLQLLVNVNDVEGFEQIVDFLNANPIKYALTMNPTIYTSCIEQFWATVMVKTVNREVQLQALVDRKKVIITEATVRRDLQLEDAEGTECLPNATIFEQLTLIGAKTTAWNEFSSTTASAIICLAINQNFNFSKYIFKSMVKNLDNARKSLMYPRFVQVFLNNQLEGMATHNRVYVTPSHTKKVFSNMKRQGKDFFGRVTPLFSTMMVQAQEEIENVVDKAINKEMDDSLERATTTAIGLDAEQDRGVNIPRSDEDRLKLKKLIELFTNLQKKVSLSARVESSNEEGLGEEDLEGDEIVVETKVAHEVVVEKRNVVFSTAEVNTATTTAKDVNLSVDGVTLAQALVALKSEKPKSNKEQAPTPVIPSKDKGKGIMVEEPLKMKKKDQISFDEQEAIRLQAKFDEEERLAREKDEANVSLTEEWNDIQAKIEADQLLVERLQAQEQEGLTDAENERLFFELLEKRKKHFASKRAEEKRNRPPTKAQQRSIMVNTFIDMDIELVEGGKVRAEGSETRKESSLKRARDELEHEKEKKKKVDDDKETTELQSLMEIVLDEEEVAIDAIPLATKPPSIDD
ncbi:hypothetical protein Tco_0881317 [Tanacetum coccineum]